MTDKDRIRITALLFGQAREMAGADSVELELAGPATVERAFAVLKERHPKLAGMERSLLFAINEEYATPSQPLADRDRLAILPPVSGGGPPGEDVFEITREPIDIPGLRGRLLRGDSGAVVIFDGVARDNTKGRPTLYLEYEGYVEMALQMLRRIGEEVHEKWPINRVGIVHRLGRIDISESSVVIVVTSAHRRVAFEACHYAIDRLKKIVPIWKKEYFEDGAVWVEGEGAAAGARGQEPGASEEVTSDSSIISDSL
ncbi:MAG TPA: molybdenum cofactor biosynthesis protein MoaE [Blastocatellia bacterium]|nr:molybdenum cofactor biosynthesis protein MoaE [Blastocatellia bacterium]